MSKRLVTGMVLALALTSTAAPAALAEDQVTSVLTPADIASPEDWQANQGAAMVQQVEQCQRWNEGSALPQ